MEKPTNSAKHEEAKTIFKPEYHHIIPIWLSNANKNELKGFKVIMTIVNKQGLKRFKPLKTLPVTEINASRRTLLKVQSQYSEAFSENVNQKVFQSEILKHVNLSALPISRTLKAEVLMFIERWLGLNDLDHYQSLMLMCLRSFYSVSMVNTSLPISTTREAFSRKKIERVAAHGHKKFYNEEVKVKLPDIVKHRPTEIFVSKTSNKTIKEIVNKDHSDIIK